MSSQSRPPVFRFLDLPPELRNMTYKHMIRDTSARGHNTLLLISKDFSRELGPLIPRNSAYIPKIKIEDCTLTAAVNDVYRDPFRHPLDKSALEYENNTVIATFRAFVARYRRLLIWVQSNCSCVFTLNFTFLNISQGGGRLVPPNANTSRSNIVRTWIMQCAAYCVQNVTDMIKLPDGTLARNIKGFWRIAPTLRECHHFDPYDFTKRCSFDHVARHRGLGTWGFARLLVHIQGFRRVQKQRQLQLAQLQRQAMRS